MQLEKGAKKTAQKIVVYGAEGIGKTTFCSHFDKPVFVDVEEGSYSYEIVRTVPDTWEEILDYISQLRHHRDCHTIIIDTADKAEQLCAEYVCRENGWKSIETPGYGKGYVELAKEYQKILDELSKATECGRNVVMCAHAMMRKFEQPDEMGAYDRWELKLNKKVAPLVKEWSDALLFANFKTIVEQVSSGMTSKAKARGGQQRVFYCTHHACWDAKNRWGLDSTEGLPFEYDQIKEYIYTVVDTKEKTLDDLIEESDYSKEQIAHLSSYLGHNSEGTKVDDFTEEYKQYLIDNWNKFISRMSELEEVPF